MACLGDNENTNCTLACSLSDESIGRPFSRIGTKLKVPMIDTFLDTTSMRTSIHAIRRDTYARRITRTRYKRGAQGSQVRLDYMRRSPFNCIFRLYDKNNQALSHFKVP
ncbi:uncharacterized protein LOC143426660 [Xylocopa sonorina]|uniref:uncharacterized protein LOC143426660 n=1 Tax=Xylocopa sonorina TaxID=1818115 RepID=UPI00403B14DF